MCVFLFSSLRVVFLFSFLFFFLFLPVQAQQKKEKLIELLFCVVLKRSGLRAGLLSLLSPFVAGFLQVREAAAFFFFFSLNETKVWTSVAYSFFPLSSVYIRLR